LGLQMTAAADAAPPYGGFGGGGAGAADSASEATNEQCVGVWRCRLLWPRRATGPSNWRRRVRSLTYRHTKAARGSEYRRINLNAFRGQGEMGAYDEVRTWRTYFFALARRSALILFLTHETRPPHIERWCLLYGLSRCCQKKVNKINRHKGNRTR
jgi:hypothetical protein